MKDKILQKNNSFIDYALLYLAFLMFSCCSIFGKLSAEQPVFSVKFFFFYCIELLIMLIYAVLWQRILKRFKLSVAYANRPVVTILEMVWGVLLFREQLTWNMVLGTFIIVFGIWIIMTGAEK